MDITRRHFFSRTSTGIGIAALGSLLARDGFAAGLTGFPNFPPTAKRVVFLHQSGGPSQIDLLDYKPSLEKYAGHRTARQRSHGPAHHRHDLGPDQLSGRAVDFQICTARPVAARGSAN